MEFHPEVFKFCNIDEIVQQLSNKGLAAGDKPEQRPVIDIIPIPKSGDLGHTTNYRAISLTSIACKIKKKMTLKRIQPHLDPLLPANQNVFRPGRSTTSHILGTRRIIEGVERNNLTT